MEEKIDVRITTLAAMNPAMQQNGVRLVREIKIRNTTDRTLFDLQIGISPDPEFSAPFVARTETLEPGKEIVIKDALIEVPIGFMLGITESVAASLNVVIQDGKGTKLYGDNHHFTILPYDHWEGIEVLPQYTATFVTPNHPDVSRILRRVCEILGVWTGDPALDEYQRRDPARVRFQAAAIYEAIKECRIAYCTSPASFGDTGQRVRMVGDILSNGIASCLDLSLMYASCLEAAGLHPILVFTQGHAFCCCWLMQDTFADIVNDDPTVLTKRISEGINEIVPVECTGMCAGTDMSFDTAVSMAADRLSKPEEFLLLVDVARARYARIRPLPQCISTDHGYEIVQTENVNGDSAMADAPSAISSMDLEANLSQTEVTKQKIWERKLLDLSLRNSLLNTRISRNTLQLVTCKVNQLEDAIIDGHEFTILEKPSGWDNPNCSHGIYRPVSMSDPIAPMVQQQLEQHRLHSYLDKDQLKQQLTYLYRSSRLSMEENGANTLYLSIGMLRWYETETSTRPRFAPILLVPVEIIRKSAAGGYILRGRDEETALNITLLEMLRQFFGINISGLETLPKDRSGVDVQMILNIVRKAIMAQKGWDVEEEAIIGNFYFSKFIMWNDIHNNASLLARNRIVASLMSGRIEWQLDETDRETPQVLLPISADASQLEAVRDAMADRSFILHGPPGTGKSQTITNIIANALYQGKKVLFVAEKMAALQVVQRRLENIGLAPFCLEIHSNKAKKTNVLSQLRQTIEVVRKSNDTQYLTKAEEAEALRKEIETYMQRLHESTACGLSLYDCINCYASYPNVDYAPIFHPDFIKKTDSAVLVKMSSAVEDYQAASHICGNLSNHPLRGIRLAEYNTALRSKIEAALTDLSIAGTDLEKSLREVQALLGMEEAPLSAKRLECICEIAVILAGEPIPLLSVLSAPDPSSVLATLGMAAAAGCRMDENRDTLLNSCRPTILNENPAEWQRRWQEATDRWWLSRKFAQSKFARQTALHTRNGRPIEMQKIPGIIELLEKYHNERKALLATAASLSSYLPEVSDPDNCQWPMMAERISQTSKLNRLLLAYSANLEQYQNIRKQLSAISPAELQHFNGPTLRHLHDTGTVFTNELNRTAQLIQSDVDDPADTKFTATVTANAKTWLSAIDSLRDWTIYNRHRFAMIGLGLDILVGLVEKDETEVATIVDVFNKSLYRTLADAIIESDPELAMFHGMMFDDKILRFRRLCSSLEQLTRAEIFARIASRLPALQKEAAQSSDVGILQRNIRNNGRGTTIRQLFDQIGGLITRMCPCMLMSPISVAQYINPGDMPFDLVIFDEASQMPTCEAVGAIARGQNVIVVGDPRQMPPTNFFTNNQFDEDNADKEDLESILDDCLALSVPSRHLLWHYRSRHESLIAFSNARFYENRLLTFPSPDDIATKVRFEYVDGIYDRGRSRQNRAEAEAVVAEIERRLSDPDLSMHSIGVVTFNTNQQSLIEDRLNELYQRRPELERIVMECNEPIFVKNLENVQGDERDVILFSVGYGPDASGKIALNFGPLNRDGGWRRLNVAVSRARYEMVVYSTLRSSDIDLTRTNAEGVAGLKAFLEYAEKGRCALAATPGTNHVIHDEMVESIAASLRDKGHEVRTNIGCSGYKVDICVVDRTNPSRYILAVICDGYNSIATESVRDREITQPGVLRSLGWNLHHLWSVDWWQDPERTITSILNAIDAAYNNGEADNLDEDCENSAEKQSFENDINNHKEKQIETDDIDNARILPYTLTKLEQRNINSDEFLAPVNGQSVKSRIKKILEYEAPISKPMLTKRLLSSYGISRAGNRIAQYLNVVLRRLEVKTTKSRMGTELLWNETQSPEEYDHYRTGVSRDANDIPEEEVMSAMRQVISEQCALSSEDLVKVTSHIFGFTRITDTVGRLMNDAINRLVDNGEVINDGKRLKFPEQ